MPKAGDIFQVSLSRTHLDWGRHRYTNSRGSVYGEGYIPIPKSYAYSYGIYNSNYSQEGLGYNEFRCISEDGLFKGIVKSTGCSTAGDIYAKNLHGSGDLKAIGAWFAELDAQVGDVVEVKWISEKDVVIKMIKR